MGILLTEIFRLLESMVESCAQSIVNDTGISIYKDKSSKHILEKEKEKVLAKIQDLVDANEDSRLVTSGEFYDFIKYEANSLIQQMLSVNSYIVQKESVEKQLEKLLELYYLKFDGKSPYERSIGANFLRSFFSILLSFKKNVFGLLAKGDLSRTLEYELNTNEFLKIEENLQKIQDTLKEFQRIYDHLEIKNQVVSTNQEFHPEYSGKDTIGNFADLFVSPLIFEDKTNPKTLKDVFIWPEYKTELVSSEQDDLQNIIQKFLDNNLKIYLYDKNIPKLKLEKDYNLLIILGMGGMGKSSLLEKIAYDIKNRYIKVQAKNIFFIKFSSMEYKYENMLDNISCYLKIKKNMLKDSVIVLDAFDEYVINIEHKQKLLEMFCQEIQMLNCRCIITSRENYINTKNLTNTLTLKLLTFNAIKRAEWLNRYNNELPLKIANGIRDYKDESDRYGEEFIGIPIILYMIVSNNIVISDYKSKFELYDALFGENGLWYKRIYDINHPALLAKNEVLYSFILKIAEKMFVENKLSIRKDEIEEIIELIPVKEDLEHIKNWYGIITYFRKNKLSEIEFAHKSIYEYYAANRMFVLLENVIYEKNDKNIYKILQSLLKKNAVSKEILDFLDGFIEKNLQKIDEEKLKKIFNLTLNMNCILTQDVFLSFDEFYIFLNNTINCLYKALEKKNRVKCVDIINDQNCKYFSFFLRNAECNYLFLKRLDLSNKDCPRLLFKNADLEESNMSNSNFSYCDFSNANLQKCSFSNSNLHGAILSEADLCYSDLRGCNLNNTIIKKNKAKFQYTKININQIKYFWPEIADIYFVFLIYSDENKLATIEEIEFEFDRIRGFCLR